MAAASARGTVSRLAVLDGLRGLAMSLVVLAHLWPGWARPIAVSIVPSGGSIAMDLFFFVSGFGIFYLFVRSTIEGGREQSVRDFAIRRMGKIFPSYYLCIVVVIVLGWTNHDPGLAALGPQILTHVLFLHNLFPQTLYGIDGVMWSLAVECQFYILFGVTRKLAMRWPVRYVAVLVAIAFVYRAWATSAFPRGYDFPDFQLPAMLDVFAFGMLCAYLYRYINKYLTALAARHTLWTAIAIATLVAIYAQLYVVVAAYANPHFPLVLEPFVRTINGALITTFALSSLFAVDGWRRLIGNRALVFVGAISYNVYLYHQVVFVHLLARFDPQASRIDRAAIAAVAVACTLAIATALKRYYEQPIIDYLRRFETGTSDWVKQSETLGLPVPSFANLVGSGGENASSAAGD
jgi:peptidoglycan/LPS O-acetylase OafA/YrhL